VKSSAGGARVSAIALSNNSVLAMDTATRAEAPELLIDN